MCSLIRYVAYSSFTLSGSKREAYAPQGDDLIFIVGNYRFVIYPFSVSFFFSEKKCGRRRLQKEKKYILTLKIKYKNKFFIQFSRSLHSKFMIVLNNCISLYNCVSYVLRNSSSHKIFKNFWL